MRKTLYILETVTLVVMLIGFVFQLLNHRYLKYQCEVGWTFPEDTYYEQLPEGFSPLRKMTTFYEIKYPKKIFTVWPLTLLEK